MSSKTNNCDVNTWSLWVDHSQRVHLIAQGLKAISEQTTPFRLMALLGALVLHKARIEQVGIVSRDKPNAVEFLSQEEILKELNDVLSCLTSRQPAKLINVYGIVQRTNFYYTDPTYHVQWEEDLIDKGSSRNVVFNITTTRASLGRTLSCELHAKIDFTKFDQHSQSVNLSEEE